MERLSSHEYSLIDEFWNLLKGNIDKLPERNAFRKGTQWSKPLNSKEDIIGIYLRNQDRIWIYVKSGDRKPSLERTSRMQNYSRQIQNHLHDQQPFRDKGNESKGQSIKIQKTWQRNNRDSWPAAASWIKEQFERLEQIVCDDGTESQAHNWKTSSKNKDPAEAMSYAGEEGSVEIEIIESEEEDKESSSPVYQITTYPADYTLEVLHRKWLTKEIRVPKFQRNFVWTQAQSSKLIESFLVGLPVPAVFLYSDRRSQDYLIIDGQQRLKSIFYYFDGYFGETSNGRPLEFRLKGLHDRSEHLGRTFDALNEIDQRRLKNSTLRAFIVKQFGPDDDASIYHIFERLNTGGTALASQEIRDCVYPGRLTESLHRMNSLEKWRRILGKPRPDSRKRDIELILRFIALRSSVSYKRPMKMFLNDFMNRNKNLKLDELARLEQIFESTCESVVKCLGERPFHVRTGLNAAVFDSVMVAFSRKLSSVPDDIRTRFNRLIGNEKFEQYTRNNTTDDHVVERRLSEASDWLFGN